MGHVVRVHDGPDPGGRCALAVGAGEEKMFRDEEVAHGQAQFVHHGSSARTKILDGGAKNMVRGSEEGFGIEVEGLAPARAKTETVEGRTHPVNVKEQAEETETQAEA
jgi:hypothetical protein